MINVSKAKAANGHEFCDEPRKIVEEAERLGLSRTDIARIANVDPSTVRNWMRKNEAALKPILRLAAYINRMKPPTETPGPNFPVQGNEYSNAEKPVNQVPLDPLSVVSPIHLTPIQTGSLGEINAVLATFGKTLAVVDLPAKE